MRSNGEKVPGFGPRLKRARQEARLTQQAAADSIGAQLRTYQRYESGTTEPTLYDLVGLAIVFGVSTDWLLGLTDERRGS